MPLYEFICQDCQAKTEQLVLGNEQVVCPECNSSRLARQFSLPAKPTTHPVGGGGGGVGCDPSLPPCNPACCRLPQGG